jgi:DNA polymerase-3 subunit chi
MAEVGFYVLGSVSADNSLVFACKLIEKAWRNGVFCHVLCDSEQQSHFIDDLLWTFREGSFIPHSILKTGDLNQKDLIPQVLISSDTSLDLTEKTVVNLSSFCPTAPRILEILDNSEASKAAGRERYRHYKQMDFTISTHTI